MTPFLILAIPRGGIQIDVRMSEELAISFDLVISRKIPLPYTLEADYGAVTGNDLVVINIEFTVQLQLSDEEILEGVLYPKRQVEDQSTNQPSTEDKHRYLTLTASRLNLFTVLNHFLTKLYALIFVTPNILLLLMRACRTFQKPLLDLI